MMRWKQFLISPLLIIFTIGASQTAKAEQVFPVDQYKQVRLTKRAYERLLYAHEMLKQSPDIKVINEAIQDAVRYTSNPNEDQKSLQAIETAINRLPVDSDSWREAVLARGKLLARLGRKSEAETLFQDAIQKNWNHAMWRYSESLFENDEMPAACILECQRIAGLEKYAKYRGEEESLEIFLTLLRLTKSDNSDISLISEVSQNLESIADKPVFQRIALALCMAEDDEISESVSLLDQIDQELSETKEHREYKHIPLYKASILFKEGRDYPAAETAFTDFMQRNKGNNSKIIASALRLARDIEIRKEDCPKIDEFMTFIINSDWFQSEEVQNSLNDDNKAEVYDMQGIGLAWSGDYVAASRIAKKVADTYPDTLAGINCLRNYALYHTSPLNEEQRIFILRDILSRSTFDETIASIRVVFAEKAITQKNYDLALEHLQDALDHISAREKGSKARYRREIEEKIQQVIRLRTGR